MKKDVNKSGVFRLKNKYLTLTVIIVLIVFILLDYIFILRNSIVVAPVSETQTIANPSFDAGIEKLNNKDYTGAAEEFEKAIVENPSNIDNYTKKSEAEYQAGDKEEAIATVEEGLAQDPENELLKSKLDVLQKDFVADPSQDTPRQ